MFDRFSYIERNGLKSRERDKILAIVGAQTIVGQFEPLLGRRYINLVKTRKLNAVKLVYDGHVI